jgi:multidrug resistance efflux pump
MTIWKLALVVGLCLIGGIELTLNLGWPFASVEGPPMLHLPGVVEIQEVRLGSKVGGRVADVLVAEGDRVEVGQLLVRFDAPELEAQCIQCQARLRAAEAEWKKAVAGPRHQEKDAARGTMEAARAYWQRTLAGAREEEVRQARSELDSAQVDLTLACKELDRSRRLFAQRSISRSEVDTAQASHDRARGRVDAARAHLDLLSAGSRPEDIAAAAAELSRARAHLDLLSAGSRPEDIAAAAALVDEIRGKLQELEANLAEATVRAPERCLVEVLGVRKGDIVTPGTPIVRVLRATDLWVKAFVPATELARLRLDQTVTLMIAGDQHRAFSGSIRQIAGESEFTPRNVQSVDDRRQQVFGVKVQISNDSLGVFKSGMAVEIFVPEQEGHR